MIKVHMKKKDFSSNHNFDNLIKNYLKVQSYKLYNDKFMIASTQNRNTEIFTFITVQIFKLFSRKVLLINRKDNSNS